MGRAPTEAVVIGSLAILILNFFLSFALNIVFPGTASEGMISVRQLHKTLGAQAVLRGVDLEVAKRRDRASSSAAPAAARACCSSISSACCKPTSGEVLRRGRRHRALPERQLGALRKKVGMLFQSGALFDSMNVEENIAFPLREAGVKDPQEIRERVAEALEMVDLAGEEKKMPENLSGGMRKRVGLARTIVSRPACILYDEPTTGLDPIATDSINHLIRRLQKRLQRDFRGRHPRYEDRLSHRRPDRLSARGPHLFQRHRGGAPGGRRPGAARLHRGPLA